MEQADSIAVTLSTNEVLLETDWDLVARVAVISIE